MRLNQGISLIGNVPVNFYQSIYLIEELLIRFNQIYSFNQSISLIEELPIRFNQIYSFYQSIPVKSNTYIKKAGFC